MTLDPGSADRLGWLAPAVRAVLRHARAAPGLPSRAEVLSCVEAEPAAVHALLAAAAAAPADSPEEASLAARLTQDPAADVLGPRFEAAVRPDGRRALGQHFTPPAVIDLALDLADVDTAQGVLDPTCGTGAFLRRAAARLAGRPSGATILGVERDPLAAALAAVNLAPFQGFARLAVLTDDLRRLPREPGRGLPAADALVGNLPYVRLHRQDGDGEAAATGLSGHADLYAHLWVRLADQVRPGGRVALVTANAFLDAGYGLDLCRHLIATYRVVAILESRCEAWFPDAGVNPVLTVLERRDDRDRAEEPPAVLGRLDRPLADLGPAAVAAAVRDAAAGAGPPRAGLRLRVVPQAELRRRLEGPDPSWARPLRAPDRWLELERHPGLVPAGALLELARGSTTNWNAFFYPPPEAGIEAEYLEPLVRSPRDQRTLALDPDRLPHRVLVCAVDEATLAARGHTGALAWIAHGRTLTNRQGVPLPEVRKGRPWYALVPQRFQLLLPKTVHETWIVWRSSRPVAVDQRLYGAEPLLGVDGEVLAAVLASTVVGLAAEVVGMTGLGQGALDLPVGLVASRLRVPDVRGVSRRSVARLLEALRALEHRPLERLERECTLPDRQALDDAVLELLGLPVPEARVHLYDDYLALMHERLALAAAHRQGRARSDSTLSR
jgi:SAM-dependent methyltransferase